MHSIAHIQNIFLDWLQRGKQSIRFLVFCTCVFPFLHHWFTSNLASAEETTKSISIQDMENIFTGAHTQNRTTDTVQELLNTQAVVKTNRHPQTPISHHKDPLSSISESEKTDAETSEMERELETEADNGNGWAFGFSAPLRVQYSNCYRKFKTIFHSTVTQVYNLQQYISFIEIHVFPKPIHRSHLFVTDTPPPTQEYIA